MSTLRPYQIECVNKVMAALQQTPEVLVAAATSSGKSHIIAEIVRRYLVSQPTARVLILCHQSEILEQNYERISTTSKGIYCAGLGRKDSHSQVILASRDSVARADLGTFSLTIIDEAHLLPEAKTSRYDKILAASQYKHLVGLTGTPWRLDNGLIFGPKKRFKMCACAIGIEELTNQGFLSPLSFPPGTRKKLIDTAGVTLSKGEFNQRQVEDKSMAATVAAINDWQVVARDRVTSIFFCASIKHAEKVTTELESRGIKTALITGETNGTLRKECVAEARRGHYKALVSVGCLTTGVDIPIIDCVVLLRPTHSASLFVQSIGRGLRLHENKRDCLVLDYTDNFDRFGSVASPNLPKAKKSKKDDEAQVRQDLLEMGIDLPGSSHFKKTCPSCKTEIPAASRTCFLCGHLFLRLEDAAYRPGARPEGFESLTTRPTVRESVTRAGRHCLIVTYTTKSGTLNEWLFPKGVPWQARAAKDRLKGLYLIRSVRAKNVNGFNKVEVCFK